jgi:2OG-Fe(II) oxygenase superfamily
MNTLLLKDKHLLEHGFLTFKIEVPNTILKHLRNQDWEKLDQSVFELTKKGAFLNSILQKFHSFEKIEHLINRRLAENDEDGIWHDDGSRLMAFSLSLNQNVESLKGGELLIRPRGKPDQVKLLGPFPLGMMTVFLTGQYGFEHKVCRVLEGERITIAGWCS